MKEFKKGHRKGSYNPIAPKGQAPRPGFRQAPKGDRPLEMHQATCVSCRKFCEVPFKPNGKKPVYCRDCFGKEEGQAAGARAPRGAYAERSIVRTSVVPRTPDVSQEIKALNAKIDTLIRLVEALSHERKAAQ